MATINRHMMQLKPSAKSDDAEWRRIHDSSPTLASFTADYSVFAKKRGRPGRFLGGGWDNRYWIVSGNFFIYFHSDKPSEKAGGCIYLVGAKIDMTGEVEGQTNVVSIRPCVPRKPGIPIDEPANTWQLSFETESAANDAIIAMKKAGSGKGADHGSAVMAVAS